MDILQILTMIGGLALFLYGMNVLGDGLKKMAGGRLEKILEKLTTNRVMGLLLGFGVTAVIQSSSATTVMIVGFVNSGLMKLAQATGVIMGANIGTTVTAWILAMSDISGDLWVLKLLKPEYFTPILAAIGIVMVMMSKKQSRRDIGTILLGFSVLMFGMNTMSDSVSVLKDNPDFQNILTMFTNPILGLLAGAVLTAIVQSSSASVGILQALSVTGAISYANAIPVILGQNIGTCVTALLSSVGTNKNARRAALIHLYFNVIGAVALLVIYMLLGAIVPAETWLPLVDTRMNMFDIAVAHTAMKVLITVLLYPFARGLERLAMLTLPDKPDKKEKVQLLDERFLETPEFAVEQSKRVATEMMELSRQNLIEAISLLDNYDAKLAEKIVKDEKMVDHYEDIVGTYLVKLSARSLNDRDNRGVSMLLHAISDIERISDHAMNIMQTAQEISEKKIEFSADAKRELDIMSRAVLEISDIAYNAFSGENMELAASVEPLEQVVDLLKAQLKARHIDRLQKGECTMVTGFVFSDLITNYERIADQCSNIAVCMIQVSKDNFDTHKYLNTLKDSKDESFIQMYEEYKIKYQL
ncbi:MAG: Na/Pi cotransporter family protein [Clostridia bacterium]|nr:Na/Pi cotransporter family protein [Clostridia bacterium]